MSGVTGFATGMIAGALWLVFFIGLGLTARNSPGHPFKSIRRFRSSTRSLDLDVPSALKTQDQQPRVREVQTAPKAPRDTALWDEPRRARGNAVRDESPPEAARQFNRPVLKPVPDLPERTMQFDSSTFFEPERPRSRPRQSRTTGEQEPTLMYIPPFAEEDRVEPRYSSATDPHGYRDQNYAPEPSLPASRPPAPPAPEMSLPDYRTSLDTAPEPPPTQHFEAVPPQQSTGPQREVAPPMPSFPPPEPFEEPKKGRFGKKGSKAPGKSGMPAEETATGPAGSTVTSAPVVPVPAVPTPAPQEKAKEEKVKKDRKGMFKLAALKPGQEPQAAVPPRPTAPVQPATPPKPRFNAPFNYVPPAPTPVTPPPFYKTVAATTGQGSPWGPPASFSPPASPSFSNWGPNAPGNSPEPKAEAPSDDAAPPDTNVAAPPEPNTSGSAPDRPEPQEEPAGPWPFGLGSNLNPPTVPEARQDPQLPAFIELSMFQDPTSADDISAEQDQEQDDGATENEEASGASSADEAWMAAGAWPGIDQKDPDRLDPQPAGALPSEETRLLDAHWPNDATPDGPPAPDWTSTDTPWPGETRRPAEPAWADHQPAAERQAAPPQWGDEAWQHEPRGPEATKPPAGSPWSGETAEQPAAVAPPDEPLGPDPRRQSGAERPVEDPWTPVGAVQPEPDPRVPEVRPADQVRPAARHPEPEIPASYEADTPSRGPKMFIDDEEDWKPLSIDLNLKEGTKAPDPITEAATRLKAAEAAIKVENGLAYVLVDDEGHPVLR